MNRFAPVDINQRAGQWQSSGWSGFDANAGPYSTRTGAPHTGQYGGEGTDKGNTDYRAQAGMTGENSGGTYEGAGSAGYTGSGTTYQGSGSFTSNTEAGVDAPRQSTPADRDSVMSSGHGEMSTSQGFSGQGGGTYERMQDADPKVHPRSSEGDYQARRDFLGGDESMDDEGGRSAASYMEGGMIETGRGTYGSQGQDFEPNEGSPMEGQLGGHQGSLAGGESFTPNTGGTNMGVTGTTFRTGGRFDDYDRDFRSDWEANYRETGYGYDRYQPAYQYGWQLGSRYQGRDWSDFETDARTDWERNHPNDAWQDFKSAIRRGWERVAVRRGERCGEHGPGQHRYRPRNEPRPGSELRSGHNPRLRRLRPRLPHRLGARVSLDRLRLRTVPAGLPVRVRRRLRAALPRPAVERRRGRRPPGLGAAPSERCVGGLQGRGSPCVGTRADGDRGRDGLREPVCRGCLRAPRHGRQPQAASAGDHSTMGAPTTFSRAEIRRTAQEGLGFESLRPGQQQVIEAVLNGHDTLAVMPTGSGKSAIYQIAGALIPGATLIVSPLIALQKDQLDSLADGSVGEAAALNSTLPDSEREDALDEMEGDRLEFIFLAPEQFNNAELMERLAENPPTLFVVDEAHCISEWGHDFRPDYLKLGAVIEKLGHPTVLALTATAAPPVRREIVERLGMTQRPHRGARLRPAEYLAGRCDRAGRERQGKDARSSGSSQQRSRASSTLRRANMPTEVAAKLQEAGVNAEYYHAGMAAKERERIHDAFMADEFDVIVATIAFGMGVDKPNVRFVFHYDISESMDAYYQEIGRAGRDGEPAVALLLYCPSDLGLRRFFASSGALDEEQVRQVLDAIMLNDGRATAEELADMVSLSQSKQAAALNRLQEAGAVTALPRMALMKPRGTARAARLRWMPSLPRRWTRRPNAASMTGHASR